MLLLYLNFSVFYFIRYTLSVKNPVVITDLFLTHYFFFKCCAKFSGERCFCQYDGFNFLLSEVFFFKKNPYLW